MPKNSHVSILIHFCFPWHQIGWQLPRPSCSPLCLERIPWKSHGKAWNSAKSQRNSQLCKEFRDSTRSLKLLPARKEEENAWRNFDINVSPSHVNLLPLKWRTNTKLKWNRNLESVMKKKIVKHNYQQIFFAYLRNKKNSNKTVSCLRKANGQSSTCPKETAKLVVELFASFFYQGESLSFPVMMTLLRTPMITS